jgi:hypothetical protein
VYDSGGSEFQGSDSIVLIQLLTLHFDVVFKENRPQQVSAYEAVNAKWESGCQYIFQFLCFQSF